MISLHCYYINPYLYQFFPFLTCVRQRNIEHIFSSIKWFVLRSIDRSKIFRIWFDFYSDRTALFVGKSKTPIPYTHKQIEHDKDRITCNQCDIIHSTVAENTFQIKLCRERSHTVTTMTTTTAVVVKTRMMISKKVVALRGEIFMNCECVDWVYTRVLICICVSLSVCLCVSVWCSYSVSLFLFSFSCI